MYEDFYGFQEKPFNLTPDPKFLYLSAKHLEAYAHLEFGLKQRGGFVMITGEVGMGKTTLCRYFLDRLDETTVSSLILYPSLSTIELFRSINQDLGINSAATTLKELVDELQKFLIEANRAGKNIVLVIDEAQNLHPDVLEQVRLISNLETATEKLIQIVLIGQTELVTLLNQKRLRQLAQRVTARYHLTPLDREETLHYIRHRLGVAGGVRRVSFTPQAIREIYGFSRGIPRIINLVCDRALLAGFVLNRREIDRALVKRAISDLGSRPTGGVRLFPWHRSWPFRAGLVALSLGALALSFWAEANPLKLLRFSREAPTADAKFASLVNAPSSAAPVAAATVEELIRRRDPGTSLREAASRLLDLWQIALPRELAVSGVDGLPSLAHAFSLRYGELSSSLEQIRTLNTPVIVELVHPERTESCFAALTGWRRDSVLLDFGTGEPVEVAVSDLERFWSRRAFLFWKDFEGLEDRGVAPYRESIWAQGLLSYLGYLPAKAGEAEIRDALKRFQDSVYLTASGALDSPTRMALYALSGRYPSPRLSQR